MTDFLNQTLSDEEKNKGQWWGAHPKKFEGTAYADDMYAATGGGRSSQDRVQAAQVIANTAGDAAAAGAGGHGGGARSHGVVGPIGIGDVEDSEPHLLLQRRRQLHRDEIGGLVARAAHAGGAARIVKGRVATGRAPSARRLVPPATLERLMHNPAVCAHPQSGTGSVEATGRRGRGFARRSPPCSGTGGGIRATA